MACRFVRPSVPVVAKFMKYKVLFWPMMILSGLVLALANGRIYIPYTISSHNVAGEYMLALSITIAVICLPVYLIRRTLLHIRTIAK